MLTEWKAGIAESCLTIAAREVLTLLVLAERGTFTIILRIYIKLILLTTGLSGPRTMFPKDCLRDVPKAFAASPTVLSLRCLR